MIPQAASFKRMTAIYGTQKYCPNNHCISGLVVEKIKIRQKLPLESDEADNHGNISPLVLL